MRGPAAGWPQPNLLLQHLLSACSRWVEGGPFQVRVWTCSKLSAPFLGCLRAPARFLVLLCALVIIPVCICTQQEHASCTVQVAPVGGMLVLWGAVPCYQRGRPTQGQNVPSIRMYRHPALQCLDQSMDTGAKYGHWCAIMEGQASNSCAHRTCTHAHTSMHSRTHTHGSPALAARRSSSLGRKLHGEDASTATRGSHGRVRVAGLKGNQMLAGALIHQVRPSVLPSTHCKRACMSPRGVSSNASGRARPLGCAPLPPLPLPPKCSFIRCTTMCPARGCNPVLPAPSSCRCWANVSNRQQQALFATSEGVSVGPCCIQRQNHAAPSSTRTPL